MVFLIKGMAIEAIDVVVMVGWDMQGWEWDLGEWGWVWDSMG